MVFIIDDGLYYYNVKLFCLKNIYITCQKLVNTMFEDLIRRKVEVYINYMIVKITLSSNHFGIFKIFWPPTSVQDTAQPTQMFIQMDLREIPRLASNNKEKWRQQRETLSYHCRQTPMNKNEIQCITCQLVALWRFILRYSNKCNPFFRQPNIHNHGH